MQITSLLLLGFLGVAASAPVADPLPAAGFPIARRFTSITSQWASESELSGRYTLYNNLWNKGATGASGSQSTLATSASGTKIAWKTTYSWAGAPTQVKSYANVGSNTGLKKTIAAISTINSAWYWTYTSASSALVADVSYDLWLSKSASCGTSASCSSIEIMIWLSARGGAKPAGSAVGTVSIAGHTWTLYKGTVSTWTVYSFYSSSEITSFTGDLKLFLTYLVNNKGVSSSQYLVGIGAGAEPFTGSATLTTTEYSTVVV